MPRSEMLARMPSHELTEWAAYERVAGPLGGERDDQLAAMIAYYTVSALGAKKAKFAKMVPRWDRVRQSWQQMRQALEALTRAHGGDVR